MLAESLPLLKLINGNEVDFLGFGEDFFLYLAYHQVRNQQIEQSPYVRKSLFLKVWSIISNLMGRHLTMIKKIHKLEDTHFAC